MRRLISYLSIVAVVLLLAGCSSSGLRSDLSAEQLPVCDSHHPQHIHRVSSLQKTTTIMVHPGLLFAIDWGGQRALDVGQALVVRGFADRVLEVRSRKKEPMAKQMLADGGGEFVGIHYSMGGSPSVLQAALEAAEEVSKKVGVDVGYSAIMVDPFALSDLESVVDPDNPYLRRVFVVLSNQYMPFRPDPSGLSRRVTDNPKFHFVYAEEFGVLWNHFSFLTDVKNAERETRDAKRGREIFDQLLLGLFGRLEGDEVEQKLYNLKLNYAKQDKRYLIPGLCRLAAP